MEVKRYARCHLVVGRVYAGLCPPGQILPETYLRARPLGLHAHVRSPGVSHGQAFSREIAKGSGLRAYPQKLTQFNELYTP